MHVIVHARIQCTCSTQHENGENGENGEGGEGVDMLRGCYMFTHKSLTQWQE